MQPIFQPDSSRPVVAIRYTTQAEETLSYFRAVRAAKELSSRALDLTQEVSWGLSIVICKMSCGSNRVECRPTRGLTQWFMVLTAGDLHQLC